VQELQINAVILINALSGEQDYALNALEIKREASMALYQRMLVKKIERIRIT
jgi:hypothetical protein